MNAPTTCFAFADGVPMTEVQATLRLALIAAHALFGEDRVALEVKTHVDAAGRLCRVEGSSDVAKTLVLVLAGYLRREFGDGAVQLSGWH